MKQTYRKIQAWIIWGLGASFFFTEYCARVAPSVMVPELMRSFAVGALALGSMSAFFYYPYIFMQIPVGTLVDKYGPRRLLTFAAILCAAASLAFAFAHELWVAELARALIGFTAAFAFVGALKLATIWFEPRKLGLLAGLTQGLGMLGACVGQSVVSLFVVNFGWRYTMVLIAITLFIVGLLIGLIVKDNRGSLLSHGVVSDLGQVSALEGLRIVFRNKDSWLNAIYAGLIYAPTGAFAELWGPSFLHRTYGMSANESALAVSTIFLGWAVGGPLVGFISDRIGKRLPVMIASGVGSLIIMAIILYISHLPESVLFILLFTYGVTNTGVAIAYAVAGELNPQPVSGLSIAFTNMASILIGALFQPIIGYLIQQRWTGVLIHSVPYYSAGDYRHAMAVLPLCLVLACLLVGFIRETNCKRR